MIIQLIGGHLPAADQLAAAETVHSPIARIDVGKILFGMLKSSQEAAFHIHPGKAGLDHLPGLRGCDEIGAQDAAVVVHRPDRLSLMVNNLLADEVTAS